MPSANTKPWYLTDMTESLYLDPVSGEVAIRTGIAGNVNISGPVTIPGSVTIGALGAIDISNPYMPISGPVTVTSMPAITQGTNPWIVSGNVNANITGGNVNAAVTGTVAVSSITGNIAGITALPAITGTVGITGNIAGITALPAITGNVNANITGGNVNAAVTGTVTTNQGTSPWIVSGNLNIAPNAAVTIGGQNLDAFGRLRVSNPYTLFDSQSRYYNHEQFSSLTATGGTVTYVQAESSFNLAVTASTGSSVIRETMKVFPYQPGKSQLTMNTFCMSTPKTNLRQRVGLFGADNGVFFENDGTYNYMVIRTSSSGVLAEERVRQDAWNGDQLTGVTGVTNPSGITLFPDRTQIFYCDVEWLGVGSVRCGFVINGVFILCHTFNHANQPGNTRVYMTTATLPVRYEITNTGATSGASTMKQICSTVISEGGYSQYGVTESAGTGINAQRLVTAETYYPVVSIRLAPTRLDSIVVPAQLSFLSTSVNYYQYILLADATLTGATWSGTSQTGSVQYDTAATVATGGIVVQSGYIDSRSLVELGDRDLFQYQLGRTLAGVSETLTLVIASTGNNADILAQLGWQELT
jgi:hypothetical protein